MTQAQEIEAARAGAWSVRPGTSPPGTFIGNEVRNGITFHYYKDNNGNYFYTDSLTDRVDAELKAARKARAAVQEQEPQNDWRNWCIKK